MRKVCSPQLGRLGKHREMGRVESQQSYHEARDLQGGIRRYNRKRFWTKGSFINGFDIDHGISISLILSDHKLCTRRKKRDGSVVRDCTNILNVKSVNYIVQVESSTLEDCQLNFVLYRFQQYTALKVRIWLFYGALEEIAYSFLDF